jgi:hypothetical protein
VGEFARRDFGPTSVAVMLPIPSPVSDGWPTVPGNGEPHVTVCYLGKLDSIQDADDVATIVSLHAAKLRDEVVTLGELEYFDNETRVAYVAVQVSDAVRKVQARIQADLVAAGFEPSIYEPWTPHATLAYLPPGSPYLGTVPTGSWTIGRNTLLSGFGAPEPAIDEPYPISYAEIQVWRGDQRVQISGWEWEQPDEAGKRNFQARAEARRAARGIGADDRADLSIKLKLKIETEEDHDEDADEADESETPQLWRWCTEGCEVHGARVDATGSWIWRTQGDGDVRPEHAVLDGMEFDTGERHPTEGEPGEAYGCRCYKEIAPVVHSNRTTPTKRQQQAAARQTKAAQKQALTRNDRAPAVHTESRVHVETVHRADKAQLLPPEVQVNGWRRFPALYSRAEIVQVYGSIREYRAAADVFAQPSMDSGRGIPWELRHSSELLTPDTVLGVARGVVLTVEQHKDGLHTCGNVVAWDRDLFDAIGDPESEFTKGWAPELSVAYRCKVDKRPGTTDAGEAFDQRQFDIVWNSLAQEPNGRAGTARILSSRLDSRAVTSADAMLAIARRQTPPTKPVFFDRREWVRFDSARQPQTSSRKDASMYPFIKALAAQAGLSEADIAALLEVGEADLEATLSALTEEQAVNLAGLFKPSAPPAEAPAETLAVEAAPPAVADVPPPAEAPPAEAPPAESAPVVEMAKVTIGEAEVEVPTAAATYIAELQAKIAESMAREDAAAERLDADANRIGLERAIEAGNAIYLARQSYGPDWSPESRKDAAGNATPISLTDWQYAAIRGAYGDDVGGSMIARIDAAPAAARPVLLTERLHDAEAVLLAKSSTVEAVRKAIGDARKDQSERADATPTDDPIVEAKKKQRDVAAGKKSPKTNNLTAHGAA